MNPIYNKYIETLGQRFKLVAPKEPYSIRHILDNEDILMQVTAFGENEEKKQFFEIKDHGFLTKAIADIPPSLAQIHKDFLKNFGVIIDLYGYKNRYLQNLVEVFSCDEKSQDMQYIVEDFSEKCSKHKSINGEIVNNPFEEKIIFAYEANGNCYLYDKDEQVYLYGQDHAYDNLILLSGYPEYTFYQVPNMKTLNAFISTLFNDTI